jgi:hypothetical protein
MELGMIKKSMTEKAIMANRRNAQRSCGPRNTNAVSRNAVKHGFLAKHLHFENEEEEKNFVALFRELLDEQKPAGPLERTLLEDAAISIWKLRRTDGWDFEELVNGRKAAKTVLKQLAEGGSVEELQLFGEGEARKSAAQRGWICQELAIRTSTKNLEHEDNSLNANPSSKTGHLEVEAKMTSCLDIVLRYRGSVKRDLYRAIAVLREMRRDGRKEVNER